MEASAIDIKIIGAGYGRTGTQSTKEALNLLGFPCYHMDEVMDRKNTGHVGFWRRVSEQPAGTQLDWQQVFANYSATIDFPSSCVWREQMQAFPDAKVLLTVHPGGAEGWYKSTTATIYKFHSEWAFKVLYAILPRPLNVLGILETLVWERTLKNTMDDPEAALEQYRRHIEEVSAAVPQDKLLIFSADQGWQPLCDFLQVEVPEEDFPRVNETAEMQVMIDRAIWAARLFLLMAAGAVGGLLYGLAQQYV